MFIEIMCSIWNMSPNENDLFVKYVWSVIAMLDTEKSVDFGNALCIRENEFHENWSKIYFAFKIAEIYYFSNFTRVLS